MKHVWVQKASKYYFQEDMLICDSLRLFGKLRQYGYGNLSSRQADESFLLEGKKNRMQICPRFLKSEK